MVSTQSLASCSKRLQDALVGEGNPLYRELELLS
jgi:hypothetical protein